MKNKIYLLSQDLDFTPPDKIEFEYADWVEQIEQHPAVHQLKDDCPYLNINGAHFRLSENELRWLKNKLYAEKVDAVKSALPDFNMVAEIAKPTKGYMFKYEHGLIIDVATFILDMLKPDKVYYIVRCYGYVKHKYTVSPQIRLIDHIIKLGMHKEEHLPDIISRLSEQDVSYMIDRFEKAEKGRADERTQSSNSTYK